MILFDIQIVHILSEHVCGTFCFHLTTDDEWELVELVKKFAGRCFPFTKSKVMILAYQYVKQTAEKALAKLQNKLASSG